VSVSALTLQLAGEPPVKLLPYRLLRVPMAPYPTKMPSLHKNCVTLYRPTGQKEMALVRDSGWKRFPPRLPDQPIFYPVLNEFYATEIAQKWNTRDGGTGYVMRFQVAAEFLVPYEVHTVGGSMHQEYWIPAGDLEEFNRRIVSEIEVVAVFKEPPG
jgi:hypothetical protein